MARRTRMTPRDKVRAAGPVTVISPDDKNERGWSRREALDMIREGYSTQQVLKITGHYVRAPRGVSALR